MGTGGSGLGCGDLGGVAPFPRGEGDGGLLQFPERERKRVLVAAASARAASPATPRFWKPSRRAPLRKLRGGRFNPQAPGRMGTEEEKLRGLGGQRLCFVSLRLGWCVFCLVLKTQLQ